MGGLVHETCRVAHMALTASSNWHLSDCKRQILCGLGKLKEQDKHEVSLHDKTAEPENYMNERWNHCMSYFDANCETIGDQQPTSQDTHMDPVLMGELLSEYNEQPENELYKLTLSEFCKLFKHWLTNFKIRRRKEVSSDCYHCQANEEDRANCKPHEVGHYLRIRTLHRRFFKSQKNVYKFIIASSCAMMTLVLSLIFDGMDQWKTYLPHMYGKLNETPSWRFKQKVTGVTLHGLALVFIVTYGWTSGVCVCALTAVSVLNETDAGDSDLNLTALQHVYWLWCNHTGALVPLPPYLLGGCKYL